MKHWFLPLWRNYKTHPDVDAAARLVLACADVQVRQCEWPHDCYSVASCRAGVLRFWSENGDYAFAMKGSFTPADGSDRLIWEDAMPSRWAVRRLRQLCASDNKERRVRREAQTPAGVALPRADQA